MNHIDSSYFAASSDIPLGCVDRIAVCEWKLSVVLVALRVSDRVSDCRSLVAPIVCVHHFDRTPSPSTL